MTMRRPAFLAALVVYALGALSAVNATPAAAAPVWNLDLHRAATNFPPGGRGELWVEIHNVGADAASGTTTLTVNLPSGISRQSVTTGPDHLPLAWACPGSPGNTTIVCTTSGTIPRHAVNRQLLLTVKISPEAAGDLIATGTLEGGGATSVTASEVIPVSPEPAGFGIEPDSFEPDFFAADERNTIRESGSHPDLFTVPFDLNTIASPTADLPNRKSPPENIRDLQVDLPPGFIGNPSAVGECSQAQFSAAECPASSQVGRIDLATVGLSSGIPWQNWSTGVVNLAHPRGVISDLAFIIAGNPVHIKVSLDPANHYAITSTVPDINETLPVFHQKLTLWGIPADRSHDSERCPSFIASNDGPTDRQCSTDATPRPFLTVPFQCGVDHTARLRNYDSWQNTGVFGSEIDYTQPGETSGCDEPRFEPDVEVVPTGKQANTPTGLDVHVKVPQNENPNGRSTPPVKNTVVTLPRGMSFSPSFADGLKSCSLAEMKLGTNEAIECPDAARIGEVTLSTPLLPKPLEGSMYLAAQGDNPFGSTFALLLVLHDTEERGVLVKIPGRIDVDPTSGQITTTFEEAPQFPFDDLTLKFRSGPRAPLVSPPSCGLQTIGVKVASWARPNDPVDASNTYNVTEGPNGTPCPPDPAHRPFHPRMVAGTLNPSAGAFSPFLFRLSRSDDEQELSQATTELPEGLVAKIAGVPLCPEQAIASISSELGTGRTELNSPACPAASQIGSVSAGLGAGPGPNYFDGKVYLAGPYKGAPLSLAVVAPGLAGPYDLGNVVVRTALHVDPDTTKVRAVTDPFPTILHGVILRVRDVRLRVDRPNTTINPTSCARKEVGGLISGTGGALFGAASPFQVAGCSDLLFKPKLSLRLFGGTHRGSHPKFRAVVTFPPGGANTAFAQVALPRSEFLDQGHIGTVCTRVQFAAEACPAASIYGTVSAKTPLLDEELKGNIYLRSSNHQLPDIVAAFRGGRIDANLVGRVDSIHGGIRNTFEFVPDVPVSSATFTFFGGKKGLLVNSRNICKSRPKATALFRGQNGDELTLRPPLKSACKKAKKQKRRARHR